MFELAVPVTVTAAVAPVTFGTCVEAVIVAEPEFAPFTGTTADVALAAKDTDPEPKLLLDYWNSR